MKSKIILIILAGLVLFSMSFCNVPTDGGDSGDSGDGGDAGDGGDIDPDEANWTEIDVQDGPTNERYYHSTAVTDSGKLIIFGGFDLVGFGEKYNDIWEYDPATDEWTDRTPSGTKPEPINRQGMVYIGNDKIIMYGGIADIGLASEYKDDTWEFDLSTNTWTQITTTNNAGAKIGFVMCYVGDDKIILYGGEYLDTQSEVSDETWEYDVSTQTWTQLNPTTSPPARTSAAYYYDGDDEIWIFGGQEKFLAPDYLNDTWVYSLSNNEWTEVVTNNTPTNRRMAKLTYLTEDSLLLFGGEERIDGTLDHIGLEETWVFTISSSTWRELDPSSSPSGRGTHSLEYINGSIYLYAGGVDLDGLNDLWKFDD